MKISPKEHRARARFARFIPTPPSVMKALRALRNATAQAFFSFLVEKCFGFGQGHADLSYKQLAEALGRNSRTVATVAKRLRGMGLVMVETLANGSFRWWIPVLAEEVKEDPLGVLRVRSASSVSESPEEAVLDPIPIPIRYDRSIMGGHDRSIMGGMIDRSWGTPLRDEVTNPDEIKVSFPLEKVEKEPLKRHDQETHIKRHHQEAVFSASKEVIALSSDDESLGHKKLLRELLELGMKQRVARKLLREHDHEVVAGALSRVALRGDIANPAGYVLCEVQDGGYEESLDFSEDFEVSGSEARVGAKKSDAPMVSVSFEQTREEARALELEREEKARVSLEGVRVLLERFSALPEGLKQALKVRWTEVKERMVPNTPRRAEILRDPRFEKMAFREVSSRFFALLDGGVSADEALGELRMAV